MRMSQPLALQPDALRASARRWATQAIESATLHDVLRIAWQRLDGGWQSYARDDVDAQFHRAAGELLHMRRMFEELDDAAMRSALTLETADETAALLFNTDGSTTALTPLLPATGANLTAPVSADGFWDWLCNWLGLGCPAPETPTVPPPKAVHLTAAELDAIFADMADEPDIPFRFPVNGCYARAEAMVQRIAERYAIDIDALRKVYIRGDLRIPTPYVYEGPRGNDAIVEWSWHIAPAVPVKNADGTISYLVVDPSLFNRPVTMDEWAAAMGDPSARPVLADRHTYGVAGERGLVMIDEIEDPNDVRTTLDLYMGYCIARGYCPSDKTPAEMEALLDQCIADEVCTLQP